MQDWESLRVLFLEYRDPNSGNSKNAAIALFTALDKALHGFFWSRLSSNADQDSKELTQIAMMKIHLARDRFDSSLSLKTWVFTIARRSLIDHWRGGKQDHEALADEGLDDDATSQLEQAADSAPSPERRFELNHDLKKALETLKPTDRTIVYLYGVEGLSMEEIAQSLDLTEAAVKLRAHRSYKQLRPLLGASS